MHGLTRTLVNNMVLGVTKGYRSAEITGVGFTLSSWGRKLQLDLGYSHPVGFDPPRGRRSTSRTHQAGRRGRGQGLVGLTAAHFRAPREPEPYKGKGISTPRIHCRKDGKAGKSEARVGLASST